MKKGKKLQKPWTSMSLIYSPLEFLEQLKSEMLKNYS